MSNISQPGPYRGVVLDRGLSKSSGGHLQLAVTLQATERYNEEAQVWEPFNYEDSEAQAYLNLITSKDKANPVNCRQIMQAFGWDGVSWATLNDPDNDLAKQIQWRMGMETYEEVERCKVQGISAYDSAPGRKVEKLDAADVRKLDAQYANILKGLGGGPKPKTAKPTTPLLTVPALETVVRPVPTAPTSAPTGGEPTPAKKRGRLAAPKTPPTPPPPAIEHASPQDTDPMAQEEAWNAYADKAQAAGKGDLAIQQAWLAVLHENYDGDESKVGENWSPVAAAASRRLGL